MSHRPSFHPIHVVTQALRPAFPNLSFLTATMLCKLKMKGPVLQTAQTGKTQTPAIRFESPGPPSLRPAGYKFRGPTDTLKSTNSLE